MIFHCINCSARIEVYVSEHAGQSTDKVVRDIETEGIQSYMDE